MDAVTPLLETSSKTFNRNAVKGRQRFSLNLCNVGKTLLATKQNGSCLPHPPSDLAACDFLLFPGMNLDLKARNFTDMAEVQRESLAVRDSISIKVLDNVSSSESSTGINSSSHKGSTLKGLKFQTCRTILNKFFF
jgi:hypothetical protein